MATYTFETVAGGLPKFKSSGGFHVPKGRPGMNQLAGCVSINIAGEVQYYIFPASDTVIIDGTTNAPGSLSVSQLFNALNTIFSVDTSGSGGSGGNSGSSSSAITLTSPEDSSVWSLTINQHGAITTTKQ